MYDERANTTQEQEEEKDEEGQQKLEDVVDGASATPELEHVKDKAMESTRRTARRQAEGREAAAAAAAILREN